MMIPVFISVAVLFVATRCESRNDRPIIGVLAQEQYGIERKYGSSYIAASYVKYLESAGARVVPIKVNESRQYYQDLFNSINGALFPGGGADLASSGYAKAGKEIYNLAVKSNEGNDYFPIWGTCLGFELLNYIPVNKSWMQSCLAYDVALPLTYSPGYKDSKLFGNIPKDVEAILTKEPVTINYHRWCLTPANYSKSGLDKIFKILTTNQYEKTTFISTVEALKYPFYAVAWHPEKNQFEFVDSYKHRNIPHTPDAILVSQYFANFFVNEARKSQHRFKNKTDENQALIYNYQPVYTGLYGSSYEQKYFFGDKNETGLSMKVHRWDWIEITCAIWVLLKTVFNVTRG